jgi:hypothetical protein
MKIDPKNKKYIALFIEKVLNNGVFILKMGYFTDSFI